MFLVMGNQWVATPLWLWELWGCAAGHQKAERAVAFYTKVQFGASSSVHHLVSGLVVTGT